MTARAPFKPSPRAEVPMAVDYARSMRGIGAMIGCCRRGYDNPQLLDRCGWLTWRWLCLPSGHPIA